MVLGEDSWESLGLKGDPTSPFYRTSVLGVHWKDLCLSWNSNTLATWYKDLTHLKSPWCWERLRAGGEGDDRGWDGWMSSLTQWTWVWVGSGSWWWTGRPGVLWFMGSQRVGHNWVAELNWTWKVTQWTYRHPNSSWKILQNIFDKRLRSFSLPHNCLSMSFTSFRNYLPNDPFLRDKSCRVLEYQRTKGPNIFGLYPQVLLL